MNTKNFIQQKCDIWETPEFVKDMDKWLFKGTKTPKQIFEENREKTIEQFKK